MPPREILVLQNEEDWNRYLLEVFEDTFSKPQIIKSISETLPLIRQKNPDVVFANTSLLTPSGIATLQVCRASNPAFRIFGLGNGAASHPTFRFDEIFKTIPPGLFEFQRRLTERLPLPDPIDLLIVDDEPQIAEMFQDYFGHRTSPSFRIRKARNGVEAKLEVQRTFPHAMVLDIKMPQRDGRELYRILKEEKALPPTVVFFDAVSVDEVIEIRRLGNRAFVEKGSHSSSMPEMAALIKKIIFFG